MIKYIRRCIIHILYPSKLMQFCAYRKAYAKFRNSIKSSPINNLNFTSEASRMKDKMRQRYVYNGSRLYVRLWERIKRFSVFFSFYRELSFQGNMTNNDDSTMPHLRTMLYIISFCT